MARLPQPGSDDNVWGAILNDYLSVEHAGDGTLMNVARPADIAGLYMKPASGIPANDMTSAVQTALTSAATAVQAVNGKAGQSLTLAASDVNAVPIGTSLNGTSSSTLVALTNTVGEVMAISSTSTTTHAMTVFMQADGGTNSAALNVVSNNSAFSAFEVSGHELTHGSIKVSHVNGGTSASADANAAAISIDLQKGTQTGTAGQGLFMTSTGGNNTGNWFNIFNTQTSKFLYSIAASGTVFMGNQAANPSANSSGMNIAVVNNTLTLVDASGNVTPVVRPSTAQPGDHGLIAWAYDPAQAVNSSAPSAAGALQVVRVPITQAQTITNVALYVATAGSGLTSGACFAAVFNSSGALLASTADQSTAWATTGAKVMALTTPQAVGVGYVYIGFYANGTTLPLFSRASGTGGLANVNLTGAGGASTAWRFAVSTTGLTTAMPSTLGTMGANLAFWAAVS